MTVACGAALQAVCIRISSLERKVAAPARLHERAFGEGACRIRQNCRRRLRAMTPAGRVKVFARPMRLDRPSHAREGPLREATYMQSQQPAKDDSIGSG